MTPTLTRANAAGMTRMTQAAALVLAGIAITLAVAGLPERTALAVADTAPANPRVPNPGSDGADDANTSARFDAQGLAARFALLENAPKIPEPTQTVQTDPGTQPEPAPDQPFATRVRYLGFIQSRGGNTAFMNVDGRQRVVRAGDTILAPDQRPELGDLTVERVTGRQVVIAHNGERATIELADRTGPAITLVTGGEVDRVDIESDEPRDMVSVRSDGHEMPQREVDRRRRVLDRQNAGIRNTNPAAALRTPDTVRTVNMNNNGARRQDTRPNSREEPEKPAPADD